MIAEHIIRAENYHAARRTLKEMINDIPTTLEQREVIDDQLDAMNRVFYEANTKP
jgi:hypothetical protein